MLSCVIELRFRDTAPSKGQQEDTRTGANRIQLTQGVKNRVPARGSPHGICRGEMALEQIFLQIIHFPLSVPILPMLRRALGPLNFAFPWDTISLLPKSEKHNTGKKSKDSNDNEIKF